MALLRPLLVAMCCVSLAVMGCGTRTSLALFDGDGGASASSAGGSPDGIVVGAGPDASSSSGGEPTVACDVGEPATVLAEIDWPFAMAQDASSLYVASYTALGAVYRVPKNGTEAVKLADVSFPAGVAVQGDWLYIAASGDRALVRVPTAGGPVEHLADFSGPSDVKVSGDWAYVANYLGNTLERVPVTGGTPEVLATDQSGIYKLALLEGHVAWGSFLPSLNAAPLEGGDVIQLSAQGARRLTTFDGYFYATSNQPGPASVFRAALDDHATILGPPQDTYLEGIAVNDGHIYFARWATDRTAGVTRMPRAGDAAELVFPVEEPIEILLDGDCLYVSSGQTVAGSGAVRRLGVPGP